MRSWLPYKHLGQNTPGEGPASTRACRWAHSAPAWLHHSLRLLSLIVCVCTWGVYHAFGDTGLLPSPPGCSAQLNCEGWGGWEGLLEGGRRRMCGKGGELSREGRFGLRGWYLRGPQSLPRPEPVLGGMPDTRSEAPFGCPQPEPSKGSSSRHCHCKVGREHVLPTQDEGPGQKSSIVSQMYVLSGKPCLGELVMVSWKLPERGEGRSEEGAGRS